MHLGPEQTCITKCGRHIAWPSTYAKLLTVNSAKMGSEMLYKLYPLCSLLPEFQMAICAPSDDEV